MRLLLLGLQEKPVHSVEMREVLRSLVLPMLVTVMVAVISASAANKRKERVSNI
jgi:hypothetical protein